MSVTALALAVVTQRNPSVAPPPLAPPRFRVEQVASGLQIPWDIEPMPDGRVFITERPGRLRVWQNGALVATPYRTFTSLPSGGTLAATGQGGLLDVVPHPNFSVNRWLYVSYTVNDAASTRLRVDRYVDTGSGLNFDRTIFQNGTFANTKHYAGRMVFGPGNRLFISTGDRGDWNRSQDRSHLDGKILRLNDDGTVPSDNPFVGQAGIRPEIWSWGNRNPQGMDIHPVTNEVWVAEHGPSGNDRPGGFDEVNRILPGQNYGWPVVWGTGSQAGMTSPRWQSGPSATAPGGCAFYVGNTFPEWRDSLFVANLAGRSLQRFTVQAGQVTAVQTLFPNTYGRIRSVNVCRDGFVWFGTDGSGNDRVFRLVPTVRIAPAP